MTIEEAIEKLKNAFKCNKKQFEELGTHILLQDDEQEAIETLLAAYEKEKNTNKELDKINYRVNKNLLETAEKLESEKRKYKKLFNGYNQRVSDILELEKKIEDLENGDLTTVYLSGFYDGEKKWKDKIKAKKEYYKSYENLEIYEHYNYGEIVQVLDELYNEKKGNKND